MWYWILIGTLEVTMLLLMKKLSSTAFVVIKPIALLVILACVAWVSQFDTFYSMWIAGGLFLSFLADLLYARRGLKKPINRKLVLFYFVLSTVCYSMAFWGQVSEPVSWGLPVFLFALTVVIFFILLPFLDSILLFAGITGIVLWQFTWSAGEVWQSHLHFMSFNNFIAAGVLSLSLLAWVIHYFKHPFKFSNYIHLCSYITSHAVIAASVVLR